MTKNITLSAEEKLIKKAREKAKRENTTLNKQFRLWLERYIGSGNRNFNFKDYMKSLKNISSGRKFTRDEMNER